MSATDRPDGAPDAASDTARPGRDETGQERGPVLAGARVRLDQALAHRAKVDDAYEHGEVRPNIAEKYPDEFRITDYKPSHGDGPHQSPEGWIEDVNFDENRKGRRHNCGECARAVQGAWQGEAAVAAAMADAWAGGESTSHMAEWAAQEAEPVSIADIGHRLEKLGPGSSAIIGCDWSPPRIGGHWFNAVNDSGTIKAVDGQTARIELWPPSASVLGFDETMMKLSDAIFFTSDGKVARNDHT